MRNIKRLSVSPVRSPQPKVWGSRFRRLTSNGVSGLIAVCLIGFGVMGNWYLVQVQPLDAPNPRLRQGFGGQAYQQLYDELLYPSVQISTPSGTGSGVVIETTNEHELTQRYSVYILSAAHVVGDEASVKVTFFYPNNNSTTITGSVVATDTIKDLALIKAYTYKPYPYIAKLAPRNYAPHIFTPIWVIGCSLGYPPRPTSGEVTAINNHWGINAPIWPGNSGGGVFLKDSQELIGIAILVKVYHGQLVSTMGSIVTLQDIYEFLTRAGERLAINGKRFALIDTPTPNISKPTPQTMRGSD